MDFWVFHNSTVVMSGLTCSKRGPVKLKTLSWKLEFLTVPKVKAVIEDAVNALGNEIDLLSIDVDGNDLYFLTEALRFVRPKLIVTEYNPKFPPPARIGIPYDEAHHWAGDDYSGASLMGFCGRTQTV